jgi:hypothetical protein
MRLLREYQRQTPTNDPQGLEIVRAADMGASYTSPSWLIEHLPILAVECAWSAGVGTQGSFQLQGSVSGVNWFNVGSAVAINATSGCILLADANAGYLFARVVYTRTAGDADLDIFAEAKGV